MKLWNVGLGLKTEREKRVFLQYLHMQQGNCSGLQAAVIPANSVLARTVPRWVASQIAVSTPNPTPCFLAIPTPTTAL